MLGKEFGRLGVVIFKEQTVKFHQFTAVDPQSPLTGEILRPSMIVLRGHLDDIFKQAGIRFDLGTERELNFVFDFNGNGRIDGEIYETGSEWQGLNKGVMFFVNRDEEVSDTEPVIVFVRESTATDNSYAPRAHAWSTLDPHRKKGAMIFSLAFTNNDARGTAAAHEIGHLLLISTDDPAAGHDNIEHKDPATSEMVWSLMRSGIINGEVQAYPGKWLRKADWIRANQTAGNWW